ncbi:MAG: UbiA family prenyltransferase [Anaerolineales bacterium]|jgi:protoheme IX farnesyltransferase|nr:UbiA family prenyltransferase [Anaerolineales bacterium]MDX9936411.1 UbiA family prenyltransferase [Anaerolineales bacterium]WKZ55633.1 MAG: UbiA family prenyltransferase [Anaerolineales bacterium]GER80233.1 protoheme IX farnesyltransferase [Candidatus Denitrolinea symbiosum]
MTAAAQPSTPDRRSRFSLYWPLTKPLQTGLLLATGLAGYMSARCPVYNLGTILGVAGSLFLAIAGSTVLNMWWDRDIDAKMGRTQKRATSSGQATPNEVLRLGLVLSALGIGWATAIGALYGLIVFAGLFFDVVVYSIWLKRRTAWSIVWGGISGAMPILAGRALGLGYVDWIGLTLALGILFWIPTHTLTFSMKFDKDYAAACVPTFPSTYGLGFTRATIAISSVLAAFAMVVAGYGIGMDWGFLRLLGVLSAGLLILAVAITFKPSERVNFGLFKYASVYMLAAMILVVLEVI